MSAPGKGTPPASPETPTVLVGLDDFGARVVSRLAAEAGLGPGGSPALGVVRVERTQNSDQIAGGIMERVRVALAHRRQVAAREQAGIAAPTRLRIFVIAHLGSARSRELGSEVIERVQKRLLGELSPIFEHFRTGAQRNVAIVPLLALPHPAGHQEGEAIAESLLALEKRVAATPARDRAVPRIFAIEDVAEYSILAEDELAQCIRNFATMLLRGALDEELETRLVFGHKPAQPLATFVCAVSELPREKIERWARCSVALEVLEAVEEAPRQDASLAETDALEELEAETYRGEHDATRDVREILDRYAPKNSPDEHPRWWERGERVRQRYGPDPGDPSLMDPASPANPPVGWAANRMKEIEESWRLLQRKRFDDVVERDRARIEKWRDRLLGRLRRRIDRELWDDPSPASFRKTQELVAVFRRAFGEQLEDAINERDAARPAPAPDFESFKSAHAGVLDAARCKPDLGRMVFWGLLALFSVWAFAPAVLNSAAEALRLDPNRWTTALLTEHAPWTALVSGLLGIGGYLGWRLGVGHLLVVRALDGMWEALRDTVTGERGSLLEYFSTRLRLSRAIARVEALLAIRAALEADAKTLETMDKAARAGAATMRDELRALGVRKAESGGLDLRAMLGLDLDAEGESMVESLVGEAGAHELARAIDPGGRTSRVGAVLRSLGRHYAEDDAWREEVVFADLERLLEMTSSPARPALEWAPFVGGERAQDTAKALAAFLRRQALSLRGALNFTGHESLDSDDVERPLGPHGLAIVPPSAVDQLNQEFGAGVRAKIVAGAERERAYFVWAAGSIAPAAVASLRVDPLSGRREP